jgi:hypothetical protein
MQTGTADMVSMGMAAVVVVDCLEMFKLRELDRHQLLVQRLVFGTPTVGRPAKKEFERLCGVKFAMQHYLMAARARTVLSRRERIVPMTMLKKDMARAIEFSFSGKLH